MRPILVVDHDDPRCQRWVGMVVRPFWHRRRYVVGVWDGLGRELTGHPPIALRTREVAVHVVNQTVRIWNESRRNHGASA